VCFFPLFSFYYTILFVWAARLAIGFKVPRLAFKFATALIKSFRKHVQKGVIWIAGEPFWYCEECHDNTTKNCFAEPHSFEGDLWLWSRGLWKLTTNLSVKLSSFLRHSPVCVRLPTTGCVQILGSFLARSISKCSSICSPPPIKFRDRATFDDWLRFTIGLERWRVQRALFRIGDLVSKLRTI